MRRPNRKAPDPTADMLTITLTPSERAVLKLNVPGPSGGMGGYQQFENWLVDSIDAELCVTLDPVRLERLIRYCRNYGSGGPNGRIRAAMVPALKRAGITVRQ